MAAATLTLPQKTIDGLEQVAERMGVDLAELAGSALRQYLRREAEKKIAHEETAYRAQHNQLLAHYEGKFIALHDGQVIDSDLDEMKLYLRVRSQYPFLGILIKRVASEIDEVWFTRSPRLERYHRQVW
ncbi:MAG: hypothetical protein M5U34_46990 [Chloroflexi bacterium]|nr:hypothetical protein [Chloroflexota bacterium]